MKERHILHSKIEKLEYFYLGCDVFSPLSNLSQIYFSINAHYSECLHLNTFNIVKNRKKSDVK